MMEDLVNQNSQWMNQAVAFHKGYTYTFKDMWPDLPKIL